MVDDRGTGSDDPELRFAQLLGVVRHELMSPLTVVQGFADLLPGAEDPESPAAAIRRNAKLALLLVERLRDADAVLGGGELVLDLEPADLAAVVSTTLSDVRETLLVQHEVELRAPDGPVVADVDIGRIRQVLFNLLSNAAKYSDRETTIVVEVRAAGGAAEIAVTDEGEGIAPEDIDRAFEAFTRLSQRMPGTGLGLAIARAIARAHCGDLVAQPAPDGPGSRFLLTLPRESDAAT